MVGIVVGTLLLSSGAVLLEWCMAWCGGVNFAEMGVCVRDFSKERGLFLGQRRFALMGVTSFWPSAGNGKLAKLRDDVSRFLQDFCPSPFPTAKSAL